MSPTDIVNGVRTLTQNKLKPAVPKKWLSQFSFGLQAYGLRAFQSATGNARMVAANAHTATPKTDRLLATPSTAYKTWLTDWASCRSWSLTEALVTGHSLPIWQPKAAPFTSA